VVLKKVENQNATSVQRIKQTADAVIDKSIKTQTERCKKNNTYLEKLNMQIVIIHCALGGTPGLQNPAKLDSSPYNPLPPFRVFSSLTVSVMTNKLRKNHIIIMGSWWILLNRNNQE
jgi:hypothetical protein